MTGPEPAATSWHVSDPQLHAELVARVERDQEARFLDTAPPLGGDDWSVIHAVDAEKVFLAPLIERFGWLGEYRVGDDGAHPCWLPVQHAAPERRAAWLLLLRAAVRRGCAAERDLVYLQDRVDTDHHRRLRHPVAGSLAWRGTAVTDH